ncbi:MAG: anaerobic ribonucleoside-triphosphate reductase activating protein [Candidatus Aenigmarchaeota archaeon]|nr:anaerobic ribonucleoside-triphosphate reductase activating protein [Candidatus Aenigmarchaeota archaeon]
MIIKGLQKQTVIDYPEKIACTIFIFGCNFRCSYCHNPELVVDDGRPEIKQEDILEFLKNRKGFLDAVCITGGEPTLNKDLPDFISKIKKLGFLVKLDTNGSNPEMLKELIEKKLVDYVAMDIKAPLESYENITNVKVNKENVQKSIDLIKKMKEYEFRITVVPDLFDEKQAKLIGEWLKGSKRFFIQQFRGIKTLDKNFVGKKSFSKEELTKFCNILKHYFEVCKIRGI